MLEIIGQRCELNVFLYIYLYIIIEKFYYKNVLAAYFDKFVGKIFLKKKNSGYMLAAQSSQT